MILKKIFSYLINLLVFLLPLAFVPFFAAPVAMGKPLVAYFLLLTAFIFWLFLVLRDGSVALPKSGLLVSVGILVLAVFISSLFSSNPILSLIGDGGQIGTFTFFLLLAIALFLSAVFFQSEKRLIAFYSLLFLASLILFVFHLFHSFLKIGILPNIFPFFTSSPIGSWGDLGIFFGFVAISSLALYELADFSKRVKIFLLSIIAISVIIMLAVNYSSLWIIFGFIVLALFCYVLSRSLYFKNREPEGEREGGGFAEMSEGEGRQQNSRKINLAKPSLILLLLAAVFIFTQGFAGLIPSLIKINIIEVNPSWSSTVTVVKKALEEDIFFGTGPATFSYDWLRFKPKEVNLTPFWSTRFQSGAGFLPSMVASIGIVGGLAALVFLLFILYYGFKVFTYNNGIKKAFLASLFFGAIYLWAFIIFSSPGFVVFALAFITTGALVGMLVSAGKLEVIKVNYLNNQTIGFVSILCLIFLLLGSLYSVFLLGKKAAAEYYYLQTLRSINIERNLDRAAFYGGKAVQFDRQDKYYRTLSDIGLLRISKVLSQKNENVNLLRSQFQNALSFAVSNARAAVGVNPLEPLNWLQLARIYESVVPFKVEGAEKVAIDTYQEALKRSPLDPSIYLGMARVKISSNELDKAKEFLQSAISLKGDYVPALYLLAQIEAQKGNLKEAINKSQQALLAAPNDIGVLFQLGLLYYQDKNYDVAKAAFERAVAISPNFSNARYFLGLIYDREGKKAKAIEQFEKIEKLNPKNKEVKKILENLRSGKSALKDISPPRKPPESRENPPVE